MATKDPRVDAYIAKAAPFARPILKHLRKLVHRGCPDVVETMKWSAPFFEHHGIMIGIAAFKGHCALIFWKGRLLSGVPAGKDRPKGEARGEFGRITALSDLPSDAAIVKMVKAAALLNEEGTAVKRVPKTASKPPARMPADLKAALAKNKKAKATFDAFPPGQKREYVEWIVEAKRPETRATRLATTLVWLAAGKTRD
ncbi:MAG: YdeI/OmpD-associated family protein, partial [Candidatus Eisenbacteria bacterium]